jgi:hypothetical protein
MGFESLSLNSFPSLEELQIEDQIRLKNIDFSEASSNLKKILLLNCKTLDSISGFVNLHGLEHIRISKTAIDFDRLIKNGVPKKLKIFAFYDRTVDNPKSKAIRSRLDKMGYTDGMSKQREQVISGSK